MAWDAATCQPGLGEGRWGVTTAPLLLVGADGNVHETRPTTSLAHDLAASDVLEVSQTSTPSRARRLPDPDERPLHGGYGCGSAAPALEDFSRAGGSSSSTGRSVRRLSNADRPVSGFAGSSGAGAAGCSGSAGRPSLRPQQMSPTHCGSTSSRRHSTAGDARSPRPSGTMSTSNALRRRSLRGTAYEPTESLLSMGFDEETARAAIAAAGGDVERALRLILEDSRAHDAREVGEWEFEGDKGWVPFDAEAEAVLKAALDRGDQACELRAGGNRYLIDLDNLTQLNLASRRVRAIRRRRGGASSSKGF